MELIPHELELNLVYKNHTSKILKQINRIIVVVTCKIPEFRKCGNGFQTKLVFQTDCKMFTIQIRVLKNLSTKLGHKYNHEYFSLTLPNSSIALSNNTRISQLIQ